VKEAFDQHECAQYPRAHLQAQRLKPKQE